jgi:predicted secreted protein
MAPTKINARDWTFEIAAQATTPTFVEIGGITTFSVSRSDSETETTDFDSDGIYEGQMMQRGKSLSCDGWFLEDASADRDAGQELVETASGDTAVGDASIFLLRVTSPNGLTDTFDAFFTINDVGGGNNDKSSWGFTATRSGASTIS